MSAPWFTYVSDAVEWFARNPDRKLVIIGPTRDYVIPYAKEFGDAARVLHGVRWMSERPDTHFLARAGGVVDIVTHERRLHGFRYDAVLDLGGCSREMYDSVRCCLISSEFRSIEESQLSECNERRKKENVASIRNGIGSATVTMPDGTQLSGAVLSMEATYGMGQYGEMNVRFLNETTRAPARNEYETGGYMSGYKTPRIDPGRVFIDTTSSIFDQQVNPPKKSTKEQAKMELFEYVTLYFPTDDKGAVIKKDVRILTEPTHTLAASAKAVERKAIQDLASQTDLDLDAVQVRIRPFENRF